MIFKKNNKIFQILSGVCFGLCAVIILSNVCINILENLESVSAGLIMKRWVASFGLIIGLVLVSIAIFFKNRVTFVSGSGFCILSCILWIGILITVAHISAFRHFSSYIIFYIFISLFVILIVSSFCRRGTKELVFTADLIFLIAAIYDYSKFRWFLLFNFFVTNASDAIDFFTLICLVLIIAGALLYGLAIENTAKKSVAKVNETRDANLISNETPIDRLVKLKNLLDNGVITQEEFDEKKKNILGQ